MTTLESASRSLSKAFRGRKGSLFVSMSAFLLLMPVAALAQSWGARALPQPLPALGSGAGTDSGTDFDAESEATSRERTLGRAKRKKTETSPNSNRSQVRSPNQEIVAPVPQSILEFSSAADAIMAKPPVYFEISASTWSPPWFRSETLVDGVGQFKRGEVPYLSLNTWRPGFMVAQALVVTKFGLSYGHFQRSAEITIEDVGFPVKQEMNLFSARAGFEILPERAFGGGWLRPFLGVFFTPSWAIIGSSEISDGESRASLALEGVAGLSLSATSLGQLLGVKGFEFELALQMTQGIRDSSMAGTGFVAGSRIEL